MRQQQTVESVIKQCADEIAALKSRQLIASTGALVYHAQATDTTYDTTITVPVAISGANGYGYILYTYDHAPYNSPIANPLLSWSANHTNFQLYVNMVEAPVETQTQYALTAENFNGTTELVISLKLQLNATAPGTLTFGVL